MEAGSLSWRLDSRRKWVLAGLAALAIALQVLLDVTRAPMRQSNYDLKLAATERAAEAFGVLRDYRLHKGAVLDMLNDPAGTGLVGPEFSRITNARGDHASKLTSLNPNWAAVIVDFCREAGLKRGDPVAVAVSGSFPGLNIAVLSALETLRLRPVLLTSVGASMWGANDPDFTWLDMESILHEAGIFTTRTVMATYGGGSDMGRGLSPEGRRLIREAAKRNHVEFLEPRNIEYSIAKRMAVYEEEARGRPYKLYINVGGGVASLGSSHNGVLVPHGLTLDLGMHNFPRKGTMILFGEKGIPVVHMLQIKSLARKFGLPIAPDYMPAPGEGEIFVRDAYRLPLAAAVLAAYTLLCVLILAPEVRRGIFDRLSRPRGAASAGLVFVMLLGASAATAATSGWVRIKTLHAPDKTCINVGGREYSYAVFRPENAATFTVTGPRQLRVSSRYLFSEDDPAKVPYTMVVTVDGQERLRKTHTGRPHGEVRLCRQAGRVGTLRKATLDIGPGKHTVRVTALTSGKGHVAGRVYRQVKNRRVRTVLYAPDGYDDVRELQFASGSHSTYYHLTADAPVRFTVGGPTDLQLYARLDFDHTMNGSQTYALAVRCDGEEWKTFVFDSRKLDTAVYVTQPDVLPGSRNDFRIAVARGRHVYEIRCLRPERCGVAVQIRIPRTDLQH